MAMGEKSAVSAVSAAGRRARTWRRAVVIGGGYTGLVSARVLSDYFDSVVVIEQDRLDESSGVHAHVPQGHHAHAVLAKGAEVLEQLFPGLRAEFSSVGAPVFDYGERVSFFGPYGYTPRDPCGIMIQSFTRDELERRLRSKVLALPGVSLRDGARVLSLTTDSPVSAGRGGKEPARVTGVAVRPVDAPHDAVPEEIEADLVVNAAGRASSLSAWLEPLGVRVPEKRVVKAKITYTSLIFARPDRNATDFDVAYQMTYAPKLPRGGVLLGVERDRWICSLVGFEDQAPPTDDIGFLEFARSLGNPHLAEHLEKREGQDEVHRYTNMHNVWHQFHRAEGWPERLIALGDSVCVFSPVYGQGLTVSALEVDALRDMLAQRHAEGGSLDGLGSAFQKKAARVILSPWTLSTSSDVMWNPDKQPVAAKIAYWYNSHLIAVAVDDASIWHAFAAVVNMIASPAVLFRPRVVGKVLRRVVQQRRAGAQMAEP